MAHYFFIELIMIRIITLNEGWGAGFPLGLLGAIFIQAFLWSYWVWQVWTLERSNFLQNLKGLGHWSRQSCTRFHVLRQGNLHCMLNKQPRTGWRQPGNSSCALELGLPWRRAWPGEGKDRQGQAGPQQAHLPCLLILEGLQAVQAVGWSWCTEDAGLNSKGHLLQSQVDLGLILLCPLSSARIWRECPPLLCFTSHHWTI